MNTILIMLAICAPPSVAPQSLPKWEGISFVAAEKPSDSAESAPTPYAEVVRVIDLLPRPAVGFVDYGCGADARWLIVAAEKWQCKCTGIEIDPSRASAARERVKAAGLDKLVTIITGDALTVDVSADVGVAYLYVDMLTKLKPRFERLKAFASYQHNVPGLATTKNGDTFIYIRTEPVRGAVWGGQVYSGPVCNSPGCAMCAAIRQQLAAQQSTDKAIIPPNESNAPKGHYETRTVKYKFCNNGRCWFEDREVQVWVADK